MELEKHLARVGGNEETLYESEKRRAALQDEYQAVSFHISNLQSVLMLIMISSKSNME